MDSSVPVDSTTGGTPAGVEPGSSLQAVVPGAAALGGPPSAGSGPVNTGTGAEEPDLVAKPTAGCFALRSPSCSPCPALPRIAWLFNVHVDVDVTVDVVVYVHVEGTVDVIVDVIDVTCDVTFECPFDMVVDATVEFDVAAAAVDVNVDVDADVDIIIDVMVDVAVEV